MSKRLEQAPKPGRGKVPLPHLLTLLMSLFLPLGLAQPSNADYIIDILDATAPPGNETREIVILPGESLLLELLLRGSVGDTSFSGFVYNWQLSSADLSVIGPVDIPNPPFDPATWIVDADPYDFGERSFGATSLGSLPVPGGTDPTTGLLLARVNIAVAPGTLSAVLWFDLLGPIVPVNGPSGVYDPLGALQTPTSGLNVEGGKIRILTPEPCSALLILAGAMGGRLRHFRRRRFRS